MRHQAKNRPMRQNHPALRTGPDTNFSRRRVRFARIVSTPTASAMKTLFFTALVALGSASALAQGWINFGNNPQTRITNSLTGQAAAGSAAQDDTQVGLYLGNPGTVEAQLQLAASTNCQVPGQFVGGLRRFPGWIGPVTAQVRAWLAGTVYPTYEAAVAAALNGDESVLVGVSVLMNVTLPEPPAPAPTLIASGLNPIVIRPVPRPSTITLTSTTNLTALGRAVIFTASVAAGTNPPTGLVTFFDGPAVLGSAALAGGVARLTTSALGIGTHSITASYTGSVYVVASSSGAITQNVVACFPNIIVSSTSNSGPGSLRNALQEICSGGVITFDPSLHGQTIRLTGARLIVARNVAILGPGANLLSISGNNASGVFDFRPGVTSILSRVTVTGGQVTSPQTGAGIWNRGQLILVACTISSNLVLGNGIDDALGGGLMNESPGVLSLTNCTFHGNSAGFGAGIFNGEFAIANVVQSTFSGNTASTAGGGIMAAGTATLRACTVAGNTGGGLHVSGLATYENCLFDANPGGNIGGTGSPASLGHNLSSDSTGGLAGPGDLPDTDPLLDPLADNGGPTLTHALRSGSPAVNAGSNTAVEDLDQDQRGPGFARVAGLLAGRIADIGAFELQPSVPVIACPSNRVAECAGELTHVNFSATAADVIGPVPVRCDPRPGLLFPPGTTTVTCTASNAAGGDACTFTVTVADTRPPVIQCPAAIVTEAVDDTGTAVLFNAPASDACGLAWSACEPPPGTVFPPGTTIVTCTAADFSGNTNSCQFTITVNRCPSATNLVVTVAEGGTVSFHLPSGDPDGDPLRFEVTEPPAHGVVAVHLLTGHGSYQPGSNFCGHDSFKFRVDDGACHSAEFTVTIHVACSARSLQQRVLDDLIALRNATRNRSDREDLADAIGAVRNSLAAKLWRDAHNLVPKKGDDFFDETEEAVEILMGLLEDAEDGDSKIPAAVLRDLIARLTGVARTLANTSVDQAAAAGASARKIAEARRDIADGDRQAAKRDWEDAVEDYAEAWDATVKFRITGRAFMTAAAGFQLRFEATPGTQYVIECSSDLRNWSPLASVTADADGLIEYRDTAGGGKANLFYRVVQP
jgi:hypothetical protein